MSLGRSTTEATLSVRKALSSLLYRKASPSDFIDSRGAGRPVVIRAGASPFPPFAVAPNGREVLLPPGVEAHEFANDPRHADWYNHEIAHVEQARRTGPFYLPFVLIGIILGATRARRGGGTFLDQAYRKSPVELAANARADHFRERGEKQVPARW